MRPSISVITASYDDPYVARSFESIHNQTIPAQKVVIDGCSQERILRRIRSAVGPGDVFISEPDRGIYDALNKGIERASGEIIGILHSDDTFGSHDVLERVREAMERRNLDVLYGDLEYVTRHGQSLRYWSGGRFIRRKLRFGWMPPHPTVFIRRHVFEEVGLYDAEYKIAGDYDFMLRLFRHPGLRIGYLPMLITFMTVGGMSNRSLGHLLQKTREDIHAVRRAGMDPPFTVSLKILRKLPQFLKAFMRKSGILKIHILNGDNLIERGSERTELVSLP